MKIEIPSVVGVVQYQVNINSGKKSTFIDFDPTPGKIQAFEINASAGDSINIGAFNADFFPVGNAQLIVPELSSGNSVDLMDTPWPIRISV